MQGSSFQSHCHMAETSQWPFTLQDRVLPTQSLEGGRASNSGSGAFQVLTLALEDGWVWGEE